MLAIVGTVPEQHFSLVEGTVGLDYNHITLQGKRIEVNRGTAALAAASAKCCEVLGLPQPHAFLVGDIGLGDGSRKLYERLSRELAKRTFQAITFHYLQPDVDWHNRVLFAVEEMETRPILIADAGFMYAAKMSGQAGSYDLFTPDVGELAFLADEDAPHPFYTRGFILHDERKVPELIARAYQYENAARCLLVKGQQDVVADARGIRFAVDDYSKESMEAIGGTGDTLTGIVTALLATDLGIMDAAVFAARINRLAGCYAKPTPATQVMNIIDMIPRALEEIFFSRREARVRG